MRSAPAGLRRKDTVRNRDGEQGYEKNHTCNIRVRTKIKGAIVILGWVGAVGSNVVGDFLSEIEVGDHSLRDCAIEILDGVFVVPMGGIGICVHETFGVGRVVD